MTTTLAWRRKFHGSAFPWLMKNATNGRSIRCPVCPCGGQWYINALCQTGACDDPPDWLQYGGIVYYSEPSLPYIYEINGNDVQRAVLVERLTGAESASHSYRWDFAGKRITAIRHGVETVPFTGEATAELFIDGVSVPLDNPTFNCASGTPRWAGDVTLNYSGGSANANVLMLQTPVELGAGAHTVDLRITIDDGDGQTYTYDSRLVMRCWSMDVPDIQLSVNAPGPWDIYVTPFNLDDLGNHSNQIRNDYTGTLCVFGPLQVELGPYNERQHAADVIAEFEDLLTAAVKCLCPQTCQFSGAGNIQTTISGGPDFPYDFGTGDNVGPASCDTAPVQWSYGGDMPEGAAVIVNGVSIENGDTGTIVFQPCQEVSVVISPNGQSGIVNVVAGYFDTMPPWEPCPLDDEESPFYNAQLEYDSGSGLGIPANSDDWEDYFGG